MTTGMVDFSLQGSLGRLLLYRTANSSDQYMLKRKKGNRDVADASGNSPQVLGLIESR